MTTSSPRSSKPTVRALLVVDIQNDFLPGGALPVAGGDEIVPLINALMRSPFFDKVAACKDFHPQDHGSFASQQGKNVGELIELGGLQQILWPSHCVAGSWGADHPDGFEGEAIEKTVYKGTDPAIDSYSAFFDNGHRKETELASHLKEWGVTDLYIVGLATDYCVLYTALDALALGFRVFVIADGCRGVNLAEGDDDRALSLMKERGAAIVASDLILEQHVEDKGHVGANNDKDIARPVG